MTKQEAIELVKNTSYSVPINDSVKYLREETVIRIIDELDEPEKPVLPQFIADWLEVCKENIGFSLSSAMSHSTSLMKAQPNKVQGWFNLKDNQETWLFGYEVKKEKLYIVEIPNPNSDNHLLLRKNFDGKVCVSLLHSEYWRGNESTRLTEAEIKEGFDWAWQFAKEVEE
ncbi:DUF1642 domain-containing protein [Streptococcus lutetiensis]|uniref:DUF1642 domain-containing protein n=1 Tax=Streptococcus lutetiensis TaxID=150055 RepID=UPI003562FA9F